VFDFMRPFAEQEAAESFWALALDTQHQCVAPYTITRGLLNCSLVHPREVFRAMIAANAASVILCHNHPSGDPTPSADDRKVTSQLVSAGRLLDIPVHDHVVMGDGKYVSFAEIGLL
jgi:DNA repair protein RadC